jgi:cytochrome c oxidase cbb3-type subunit 3
MRHGHDDLMGHDYDGIQEYDNPLPGWWTAVFALTVAFSAGYWAYYHVLDKGASREADFLAEVKEADLQFAKFKLPDLDDDAVLAIAADPKQVERGKAVYAERCAVCHGDKAEGKIGPNLTDAAWIHGGKPAQVFRTIGNGVTTKGMPAWRLTLEPRDVQAVTAFVWSVRHSNVPGKAPQGVVEAGSAAPAVAPAAVSTATGHP